MKACVGQTRRLFAAVTFVPSGPARSRVFLKILLVFVVENSITAREDFGKSTEAFILERTRRSS
jgi:hypothetical protein